MAHYEENLANPPLLDGALDRAPIEGAFFDCIPSALRAEKRAYTTDANGEREREREREGKMKLGYYYLRPNSSFSWDMVRQTFSTRPCESKSIILPLVMLGLRLFCNAQFKLKTRLQGRVHATYTPPLSLVLYFNNCRMIGNQPRLYPGESRSFTRTRRLASPAARLTLIKIS